MPDYNDFRNDISNLQWDMRVLSEKPANADTLFELVQFAQRVLDTDQTYTPRPERPQYPVKCRMCGTPVRTSQWEGMVSICEPCEWVRANDAKVVRAKVTYDSTDSDQYPDANSPHMAGGNPNARSR